MSETIRIEDMRVFAKVAEAGSFTIASRALGVPKQTLSRRVADLERALGARLMHRTTRRLHLTTLGAAYAERCAEIVRIADLANRAVADAQEVPRGTLRVTADPVFGEAFLTDIVIEYARRWPEVRVEVVLTRRKVDVVEEGFDVAFRIGQAGDSSLSQLSLGAAKIRYCANADYLELRGTPTTPECLARHDCIVVGADGAAVRWPFRGKRGTRLVPVSGRLRSDSFAMARAAALAGLGIAIFPEFACTQDVEAGRLRPVLDDWLADVGAVWLVHSPRPSLTARVRAFADLARERFAARPPWVTTHPRANAAAAVTGKVAGKARRRT